MNNVCCIILAAGAGKRMKSNKPKVLSEVLFKPMIKWILDTVRASGINDICIVSGHMREKLEEYLKSENQDYYEAIQSEQKGTAHAVMMASNFLEKHNDYDVLVLSGDNPLIDKDTIINSLKLHREKNNSATVISSEVENPFGYGRIIRDSQTNKLKAIVEHKDLEENQKNINEINSGAYWFNVKDLRKIIFEIDNNNAQGEYYLPDTIKIFIKNKNNVSAYITENPDMVLGANDRLQLYELNEIARNKVLDKLILSGVNIPCKDGIIISSDADIMPGCEIYPGTIIKGNAKIGEGCIIGPNVVINNCDIKNSSVLNNIYK